MTAKAMDSIAPSGNGTDNTLTGVATLDATQRVFALPDGFASNYIRVKPVGAAVRWVVRAVAVLPGATGIVAPTAANMIDNATATAADPPSFGPKVGSHVADGVEVERELPGLPPNGGKLYFAWQGLGAGTFLQIEKGSGKPATTTEM